MSLNLPQGVTSDASPIASTAWPRDATRYCIRAACLVALLASVLLFSDYPLGPAWPALLAPMYLGAALVWPRLPLFLLPLLLPVLNLAPWTGRFFFDEFDLFLLLTVVAHHLRGHPPTPRPSLAVSPSGLLCTLFLLSSFASIVHGAWPLTPADLSDWNSYQSPANGLRIGKSLLWACLLLPLLRHHLSNGRAATLRIFCAGMSAGLLATVAVILRERAAFPGVFDFDRAYRVCGPFFEMHVGGAAIEAYLVMALPFAASWSLDAQRWGQRLIGILLFIAGIYALLVTYARGGYGACLVAMGVLFGMLAWRGRLRLGSINGVIVVTMLASICLLAFPVLRGGYMQARLRQAQQDLGTRAAHWRHAIAMMQPVAGSRWVGLGSGRFPARYLAAATAQERPSEFNFARVAGKPVLQLQPGLPLRVEQIVAVLPNQPYHVTLRARAGVQRSGAHSDPVLSVSLCERWLLFDAQCAPLDLTIKGAQHEWRDYGADLSTKDFSLQRGWLARPVKFSLTNTGAVTLEIDSVSLSDGHNQLLANRSFEDSMDHWYFSTEAFEAWHFENTWLQLYFEQGLIGLLLFILVVTHAGALCVLRYLRGDDSAPLLAAVLAGFLALGTLDSLFDFPRLGLLFYLLLSFILVDSPRQSRSV